MNQNYQQASSQRSSFFVYSLIYKNNFRTIQFIILANVELMTHTHLLNIPTPVTNYDIFPLTCLFKFIRTKDINAQYRLHSLLQPAPEPHLAQF